MPKTTVIIGNFDGVHNGHRRLIQLGKQIAEAAGETLAVFTFYPQPQELFQSEFAYLLSKSDKEKAFHSLGVEHIFSVPFQKTLGDLPPEAFVEQVLKKEMNASHVVVGFNFTFGRGGKGTSEDLKKICAVHGMDVTVMQPYVQDDTVVSSSVIRQYLMECNIEKANAFLGYRYSIEGVVEKGKQLGRTIGYPTANIHLPEKILLPGVGVYAAITYVEGVAYQSFLNIGYRPTVEGSVGKTVEVHIFDFSGDLYGQVIRTELYYFMRGEKKFSGLDTLKQQLHQDEAEARALLGRECNLE